MKQKLLRQIIAVTLISVSLFVNTPVPPVLAQSASDSAIPVEPFPTLTTPIKSVTDSAITNSPTPQPVISPNLTSGPSAVIRLRPSLRKLQKNTFQFTDDVLVQVDNADVSEITTEVTDAAGGHPAIDVTKIPSGLGTMLRLHPTGRLKPGKYHLIAKDTIGNTFTQDFTWGVLAINTDKAIYEPNEAALISMAVLNEMGKMVCDANVTLTITAPDGTETARSTGDNTIIVSPTCSQHVFTLQADYATTYETSIPGNYTMALSAVTGNGTYSISDGFIVSDSPDFSIQRSSATRIYPPETYPMTMIVTAKNDFSGTITETVPSDFSITSASASGVKSFDTKAVVQDANITQQDVLGASVALSLPFSGNHKVSEGFGQHETDPVMLAKYTQYGLAGHDGIDFDMPDGTPVLAADEGTVVLAKENSDYGTTIVIQHAWGKSYYGHLSKLEVSEGDLVKRGAEIGLSGHTGLVTGPHLHFGVKPNNPDMQNGYFGKIDPSILLGLKPGAAVLGASTSDTDQTDLVQIERIVLTWHVSLKKGETITLGYQYKTPEVSPAFYLLGPLRFFDMKNNIQFTEGRQWQLAIDYTGFPATSYLSNTASGKITATTSWQLVTSAPAAANTTTSVKQAKNAVYFQWLPGTAGNTTQAVSAPTTPDGKGFIYDTSVDGTIPTGTWAFNTNTTTSSATGTGHVVVCAWKVTVSGGAITGNSTIFPSSAACSEGATNIMTTANSLFSSTVSVASVASQTFSSSQYLYVEYWLRMTGAGTSTTATTTFQTNAGLADDIVTPGTSTNALPAAPSQDSPANSTTGLSTIPIFKMTAASDTESDPLQYKVTIYNNSGCSSIVQTNDESSSQTGWSGQNATFSTSNDSYTPGTQATYTTQTALAGGVQYWWKASVKDTNGTFVDSSTCNTFTTAAPGSGGFSTPTLVQSNKNTSAAACGATNLAVTLGSSVTVGNTIIISVSLFNNGGGTADLAAVNPMVDNKGNTYSLAVKDPSPASGAYSAQIWSAPVTTGGTSFQVTATASGTNNCISLGIFEYSGLTTSSPVDRVMNHTSTSTLTPTSNSTATTTQTEELLFGVFNHQSTANPSAAAGSGYNIEQVYTDGTTTGMPMVAEDQIVNATGAYAATMTWGSSQTSNGVIATFKAAGSAGTPTLDQLMRHGKWFNGGVKQPFTF